MKIIIFLYLFSVSAWAVKSNGIVSCQKEARKFCPEEEGHAHILSCLLQHEKQLATGCKQELQRLTEVAKDAGTRGGGGLSSFGGVMGGFGLLPPQKKIITLNGVHSLEGRPTLVQQGKVSLATPVWSDKGASFSMSAGAGTLNFKEKQLFDNGTSTPTQLHRVELGAQYSKSLGNKKMLGMRTSIGSASDKPFHSRDEMTFNLTTFYAYPTSEKGYWVWSVFLSNNNTLANYIPIPGFIYFYKNEGFTGMFGLPFLSMQWTPKEPWVLSLSFFITNLNSEIAYGFRDKLQFFTGFTINQQSFLREDRDEFKDRLFYSEKKIFLGFRTPLTKEVSLELQAGEAFDRALKEGKRFNETDFEADLGRSYYSSLNVNFLI